MRIGPQAAHALGRARARSALAPSAVAPARNRRSARRGSRRRRRPWRARAARPACSRRPPPHSWPRRGSPRRRDRASGRRRRRRGSARARPSLAVELGHERGQHEALRLGAARRAASAHRAHRRYRRRSAADNRAEDRWRKPARSLAAWPRSCRSMPAAKACPRERSTSRPADAATARATARRAVAALVIDQHDRESAGIVLREQRGEALRQHRRLVAGRDHGHDARPCAARREGRLIGIVALARAPEPAPEEEEVNPDRERESRQE